MSAKAYSADARRNELHSKFGVDVIIRFHDLNAVSELDRALFSLFHQTHPSVRPVILAQGFDREALDQLERLACRYDWSLRGMAPAIVSVDNPEGRDIRSRLLNVGLKTGTGRYFAVLDADDYWYGKAAEWLVAGLEGDKYAMAFGDIIVKNVSLSDGVQFIYGRSDGIYKGSGLQDLMEENFCPIHSFVLDRCKVDIDDLYFNESLSRLEDYDFLIRICTRYPVNFGPRSRPVGVYNWKSDGSNSTVLGSETRAELAVKQRPWEEARAVIELSKREARQRLGW